jgi:hypothetical protein
VGLTPLPAAGLPLPLPLPSVFFMEALYRPNTLLSVDLRFYVWVLGDFEHAVPYDQGGKTCACNAGARSRRCHRVKQSPGWTVTQPRPGWHQWTTPAGWTYTQGPYQYPA